MLRYFVQVVTILSGLCFLLYAVASGLAMHLYYADQASFSAIMVNLSDPQLLKAYGVSFIICLPAAIVLIYMGFTCWGEKSELEKGFGAAKRSSIVLTLCLTVFLGITACFIFTPSLQLLAVSTRQEPLYVRLAKGLDEYRLAASEISQYHYIVTPNNKSLSADLKADLDESLPKYRDFLVRQGVLLDKLIQQAGEQYGADFSRHTQEFLSWKRDNQQSLLKGERPKQGQLPSTLDLSRHVHRMINDLRQATGIYHVNDPDSADVMKKADEYIAFLQSHPNDPDICTSMTRYDYDKKRPLPAGLELSSKQIAFMRAGEQYCSDYYHNKTAWAAVLLNNPGDSHAPYAGLSYQEYYDQEILPYLKVKRKNIKLVGSDDNQRICSMGRYPAFNKHEREPEREADVEVVRELGQQYCEHDTMWEKSYGSTGLFCIDAHQLMSGHSKQRVWDILEKCRETAGPLFSDTHG